MGTGRDTIEVVTAGAGAITPGELWLPSVGDETLSFLDGLPEEARSRIQHEARDILSRSVDPDGDPATRAGLVVGYVQSGKTTSMIAAAAMGRDNGFGLVVFIAGTSDLLLGQSRQRLEQSLRLSEPDAYRRWVHFPSPKPGSEDSVRLAAALQDWVGAGDERATVLVTVMKQHKHLKDLADVLREAGRPSGASANPRSCLRRRGGPGEPKSQVTAGQGERYLSRSSEGARRIAVAHAPAVHSNTAGSPADQYR